ncbi:MAG: CHAT domain-containing protein [bacterium]
MLNSTRYQNKFKLVLFTIISVNSVTTNPATATFPAHSKYLQAIELAGKSKYSNAIEYLKQQITEDSTFVPTYFRIAEFYRYAKKLTDCQTYFQNAINQSPENPNFYLGLALMAKWSKDWKSTFDNSKLSLSKGSISPEALDLLVESSLKLDLTNQLPGIFRKLKRKKSQRHLNDLGYAIWRYRINNFIKAKTTLQQYLKKNQKDWFGYYYLGRVSYKLKEYDAVFTNLQTSIQLIGQSDPYKKLKVLQNLGSLFQKIGKLGASEKYLYQALQLAQRIGAWKEQIKIQQARSILYMKERYYQRMAEACLNGILLAQKINEISDLSNLYYNLAYAYGKMGNKDNAINYYLLTIEQAARVQNSELLTKAYTKIGREYLNLSNLEKAFDFLNKSLKVAQEAKLTELEHYALLSIADIHKAQGDIKSAKQNYKKVLKYAQRTQKHKLTEICFLKLASLYLKPTSNLQNAKYYLSLADAFARQTLQIQYVANHRWMQGRISLFEGEVENAETLFLDAVHLAKETGSYGPILAGHAGLINTYLSAGCPDLAVVQSDTALKSLNEFESLFNREISSEFFDLNKDLFFPAVRAFAKFGNLLRAYEICEQYKVQTHWNNISPIKFKIKSSLPDSIKWKYDKINTRIIDRWLELRESWRKDAGDNLDLVMSIKNEIQQLQAQKKAVILELAENYPRYFTLVHPEGESLSNLQKMLKPIDGSFIHYLVGENATFILLARPDSIYYKFINVGSSVLERLVEQMSPLFSQRNSDYADTNNSEIEAFRLDVAAQLYQVIFEPIVDLIPPQSPVIISPDDVLNRFPFECLVTNQNELTGDYDYAHAKFLVEDYKISYVPYAKMLNWRFFRKRRAKKSFLAFANPSWNLEEMESLRNNNSNGKIYFNLNLKPSKISEYEAAQIVEIIGKRKAKIFSGQSATKTRFLQESSKYQIIHLALPGILDDRQSLYSKLYFSNQKGLNEFLTTYELFNLKLNADLVIISDLGRESKTLNMGESVKGLVHGFIYSGVPSVVTNLWKGHKIESSDLVVNFYSNLKLGMNKSAALQQAKVQYLKTENRNPYYWALYVLNGNLESIKFNAQNIDNLFLITILGLLLLTGLGVWQFMKFKKEIS